MDQSSAYIVGQLLGVVFSVALGALVMSSLLRLAAFMVIGHATSYWQSWKASFWSIAMFGATVLALGLLRPEIYGTPAPAIEIPCLIGLWFANGKLFGSRLEDGNGFPVGFGQGAFVTVVVLGLCFLALFFYGSVFAWSFNHLSFG